MHPCALDQYVWDSTEFEGVEILVSRRVWHGFASVNCCGTGLILSRNSKSSLCGETLSYKKNWTSGRPKSCTRWPSCKLVRVTSLTTSPCPLNFRHPLLILARFEPHFVIVAHGTGEHHWHHGMAELANMPKVYEIASWCEFEEICDLAGLLHSSHAKATTKSHIFAAISQQLLESTIQNWPISPAPSCRPKRGYCGTRRKARLFTP